MIDRLIHMWDYIVAAEAGLMTTGLTVFLAAGGLTDPQFVAALFAGIASLLVAIATLIVALRTKGTVNVVHALTNSRLTEMVNKQTVTDQRVEQLLGTLNRASVDVPAAPNVVVSDRPVLVVPPPVRIEGEGTGPMVP